MRYKPYTFRVSIGQQLFFLAAVVLLSVGGIVASFEPPKAKAATSSTINFQARLMTGAGGIVPDGFYNVEFKIYSQSSGGSAAWTETYYDSNGVTAGNDNRVRVANGYLTVNLGSQTSFGAINWDQEFWISMNVGGTTQTATPAWDGEMDPRLKLTAVPYAFRAGQLAKLTGSDTSTLSFDTQTGARNILLPDEGGTLCIRNSSACGFVAGSATNFIQNTTTQQTSANFNIDGTGVAGALQSGQLTVTSSAMSSTVATITASSINTGYGLDISTGSAVTSGAGLRVTGSGAAAYSAGAGLVQVANDGAFTGQLARISSSGTTTGSLLNLSLSNASQTTASALVVTQSGVTTGYTGNLIDVTGSSTTGAGNLLNVSTAATTAGNALNVTAHALTTGVGVNVASTSTGLTSGSLLRVTTATTGAVATNGVVSLNASGNYTSTSNAGLLNVAANATTAGTVANVQGNALTTGVGLNVSSTGTGLTSGSLLRVTSATTGAVATNGIVSLNASGNYTSTSNAGLLNVAANATTAGTVTNVQGNALTTGVGVNIASTGTGLTSGSLLRVTSATTGAVATNGIISLNASGNYTSTSNAGLLNVAANATTAGTVANVQGNALTTGVGLNVSSTGTGLTSGSLARFTSATTGAVATNGIVSLSATGNYTSTSNAGLLNVAANTTTAGTVVNIQGTSLSTGTALNISTASSTGTAIRVNSGLTTLTGATTGDALNVSNTTSTGNIAVFSDNATAVLTLANGGTATFRNETDSATALQIQSATGADTLFSANTVTRASGTAGNVVKIGNSTGTDTDTTILQLDATGAVPSTNLASLNGGLFYNSATGKISIIENGVVKVVCNATDLACGSGTVSLQGAYAGGNTISTTGNDIAFTLNGSDDFTVATAAGATGSSIFALADGSNATPPAQLVLITNNDANESLPAGLVFSGTIGTDISRSSGVLTLAGTGGVTVTAGGTTTLGLDTAGAGTVNLGNTNATTIGIGGTSGATTTIAGGNVAHTVAIAAGGTSSIQGVTIGSVGSTSTTTIQGGTGTATGDINIGDQTTAGKIIDIGSVTNAGTGTVNIATTAGATQTVAIGGASVGSAANGTTVLIQGGNTANAVNIQSLASGTISIGTNAAGTVTLGHASGTVKLGSLGSATANAASVCRDTSTTDLIACDANTIGRPFLQGGNTFGVTGVLGTNDSNSLQFETNNVVRATFDTSNNLYFGLGPTAASPTNFTVAATGSTTAGTAGASLTLQGGAGASATTGSAGGNILIAGGDAAGSGDNAGGTVTLQGGLDANSGAAGTVLVKNSADSATAFRVQNAAGTSTIFDVDTSNGRVGIGTAAPDRTLDIATNSSSTTPAIRLSQAGTGDTSIELAAPSAQFYVGVDGSDNTFKISSYAANAGTINAGYHNDNPATANQDHGNPGLAVGTKVSSTSAGTLSSINIYIGSVSLGAHVKVGLYADNGTGLAPGNLIATSAEITPTANSWNAIPVSASIAASTAYWLVYRSDDAVTGATRYNTTGNMAYVSVSYGSAWPNPFGTATTNTNLHYLMSMTYAVSASVDPFGKGLVRVGDTGQAAFQNSVDSTTAFRVQNAAASSIFGIDTSNGRVGINTDAPTADLSFGAGASRTINVLAQPTAATAGNNLTINSGQGNTSGAGGILTMQAGQGGATGAGGAAILQGGSGGSTSGAGGAVTVRGGTAAGANTGGLATVVGGTAAAAAGSGGGGVAITGAAGSATSTGGVGGGITLQGGNAGGSGNNTGGAISLTAGNSTGTTVGGGISLQAGTGGSSANGGTISITGGTGGAATRLGGAVTVTGGTGVTTGAGGALTLQGGTGGNAATGGVITVQGGSAGGGNTNGANVNLVGGVGAGTGVKGLVVVDTATFSTATTQSSATSTNITQANIDSFGAIVLNATAASVTFTLSDPTLGVSAAGRLVYVIAANGTSDFTLRANAGEGTGIEQNISMRQNTTATMIWTGTNWTAAGASSSTTLQSAYDSTLTSAGGAELVLNAPGGNADGLTIRNNGTTPITGGILEVQSSIGTNLFSVNNFGTELANNGGAETAGGTSTTFPANTWTAAPVSATISRTVTAGNFVTGQAGVQVATTTTANSGVRNNLTGNPVNTIGAEYQVSFTAKSTVNGTPLDVQYSRNGGTNVVACTDYGGVQTLSNTVWTKITCTITIDSATAATDPDLIIRKTDTSSPTIYIDNLSFIRNDTTTQPSNVQVGGGINGGQITLFTLDRSSAPPVANGDTTYLGSMYYDTTTGRIQCYESDGWGACGSAPDNIISLTPEYPGAVLNGTGIGTMTADFCANQAGISFQVNSSFCASGLSRQYYRWTSPQATEQTYSIYVSYKLPNTFKEFASNSTITLTALTDSTTNGSVTYEVFRSTGSAITRCYDGVTNETAVTSSNNTWQTVGINGSEQSGCGFAGGDNVIFKINMKARSNANVYVENLNFIYLNQ